MPLLPQTNSGASPGHSLLLNSLIIILAMILISALLIVAITHGIDGVLLGGGLTIIGGLGGYHVGRHKL